MDLLEYQQKEFDREIGYLKTKEARFLGDTFCPRYEFPTQETMINMLKEVESQGITSISFGACELGAKKTKWLAEALCYAPSLEKLALRENKIGQTGAIAIIKKLPETKISHLDLTRNELNAKITPALVENLAKSEISSLNLGINSLGEGFLKGLATVLPQTKIQKLGLESSALREKEMPVFAEALKSSNVTDLNIRGVFLYDKGLKPLLEVLPDTKINKLNIEVTGISAKLATDLMQKVPSTPLTSLVLSLKGSSDNEAEALYAQETKALLTDPACRLEHFHTTYGHIDDENQEQIKQAHKILMSNVAYRKSIGMMVEKNKDVKIIEPNLSLHQAFDQGLLFQMLQTRQKPLSYTECSAVDEQGNSLLAKASRAELLPIVFSAEYWNNAKEMGSAWQAVGKGHHWQMDGKKERPFYQKQKNEVMQKAVHLMLKNKQKSV